MHRTTSLRRPPRIVRRAPTACALLVLLVAGCAAPPPAEEPELRTLGPDGPPRAARMEETVEPAPPEEPRQRRMGPHLFAFSMGPGYWPGLGDVDPSSSGFSPSDFGEFAEMNWLLVTLMVGAPSGRLETRPSVGVRRLHV